MAFKASRYVSEQRLWGLATLMTELGIRVASYQSEYKEQVISTLLVAITLLMFGVWEGRGGGYWGVT